MDLAPVVLRCPVCGDDLASMPVRRCAICETPVHQECSAFIGGCARFGCAEAATPRKRLIQFLQTSVTSRQQLELAIIAVYGYGAFLLVPGPDALVPLVVLVAGVLASLSIFKARRRLKRITSPSASMSDLIPLLAGHAATIRRGSRSVPGVRGMARISAAVGTSVLALAGAAFLGTSLIAGAHGQLLLMLVLLVLGVTFLRSAMLSRMGCALDLPAQLAGVWRDDLERTLSQGQLEAGSIDAGTGELLSAKSKTDLDKKQG